MEKIKVLIVEDKLLIAEDIAARLRKHDMNVIGICPSGEEAVEQALANKPDLILMDVELSGAMDGISTAQIILQQQYIPIIYLSDFTDSKTLERAKKTQPANYLTKPFNEGELVRAIDLAFSNANAKAIVTGRNTLKGYVFLRTENQVFIKLGMDDILYLQADRAYCKVVTSGKGEYILSTSMNHIHEQLDHEDFIKVHRSFIINANGITSLEGNVIKMGTIDIQMGKEYRENLMNVLKIVK